MIKGSDLELVVRTQLKPESVFRGLSLFVSSVRHPFSLRNNPGFDIARARFVGSKAPLV